MPGFILHLTAGEMFFNWLKKEKNIVMSREERNRFCVGNLMPDTTADKRKSHFRNPECFGKMVEYPDLELFMKAYGEHVHDPLCMGYLFHLYIDRRFFLEYLPRMVEYLDEDDRPCQELAQVKNVQIRKAGEKVPLFLYFSEEYYYGDYTRMNTYLAEKYHIPLKLDTHIENTYIKEASCEDVADVLEKLRGFMDVPVSAVRQTRVFDVTETLDFLETCAKSFLTFI